MDVDRVLAETFAEHAHDAPDPDALLDDIRASLRGRPRRRMLSWLPVAGSIALVVAVTTAILTIVATRGTDRHHVSGSDTGTQFLSTSPSAPKRQWPVTPPTCTPQPQRASDDLVMSVVSTKFTQPCYFARANTPLTIDFSYSGKPLTDNQTRRASLSLIPEDSPPCAHYSSQPGGMLDCSNEGAVYASGLFEATEDGTRLTVPPLAAGNYVILVSGVPPTATAVVSVG